MADISHLIGNDLALGLSGGLAVVDGTEEGQQRVLRRLMTAPTSMRFHLEYGAGLAQYLGRPMFKQRIQAAIIKQMKLEKAVRQNPPPSVTVTTDQTGLVIANITYVDAQTDKTSALVVPITS